MPTLLNQNGFRVMIYTDDHEPMHVHVFKQGEIIVNLGDENTPVSIRKNYGMSRPDARRALILVGANQEFLQERWREIHG